jgi:hypothetical protein
VDKNGTEADHRNSRPGMGNREVVGTRDGNRRRVGDRPVGVGGFEPEVRMTAPAQRSRLNALPEVVDGTAAVAGFGRPLRRH